MDKRVLTADELALLKQFIISRSARFAEPGVLLEILDHFACKTEEVLAAEPGLSLEMAMKKAHHAFGIKGFAPIADTYEQQVYSRYKKWHKTDQIRILCSVHGLGCLLAGLLFAKLYVYAQTAQWMVGGSNGIRIDGTFLLLIAELIYAAGILLAFRLGAKARKHPLLLGKAREAHNRVFLWIWLGFYLLSLREHISSGTAALAAGFLVAWLLLQYLSHQRLMKKVQEEIVALEDKMQLLA